MSLYILQKSPFSHNGFKECLEVATPEDGILLIHDAVYALNQAPPSCKAKIWALTEDATARGITHNAFAQWASMNDFVALTEKHTPVVSWD